MDFNIKVNIIFILYVEFKILLQFYHYIYHYIYHFCEYIRCYLSKQLTLHNCLLLFLIKDIANDNMIILNSEDNRERDFNVG